ncbi:alpha-ketoglutarate-dependent dioxygenase AlkB family protein [Luteolibacter marinus]|uniref:alpha-ketoglutarate-dependent dioxygenase AlkB family protein n=1 Tax=Luteolibacter marinus TaxID=2776705 RepID=UPI0018682D8D|nr:alpha-ketoglutarate-dependent dioxygenase AlkB [Luteolibacter marinus]
MELFRPDPSENLLPRDGTVNYHGVVLAAASAANYYDALISSVPWRHDEAVMFGKHIVTARKVAWYGDSPFPYTYSGTTKQALAWSDEMKELKSLAEQCSGCRFNSCLLNLYHDGNEGMGWHSDDEKSLVADSGIASLSFGAERRFDFKHKQTGEKVSVTLENGSLLVMKGTTQTHWLHQIPKSKRITTPRINLTFRRMA